MDKASEAGESVQSVQISWTDESEFLGEKRRSETQGQIVGEDLYMKITDEEDGESELLQYHGRMYTRASGGDPWVLDPDLQSASAAVAAAEGFAGEALIDPSFDLARLPNETVDGREYYRVSGELAADLKGESLLEPLNNLIDIAKRLPAELVPDEAVLRVDFWIAVGDFNLYRWTNEGTLYHDGEATYSARRLGQASAFNEPLELPGPLP